MFHIFFAIVVLPVPLLPTITPIFHLSGKFSCPLILNDKTENYINNYIDYHQIDTRKPIHFVKGDLHQSATQYGKRFRYRVC